MRIRARYYVNLPKRRNRPAGLRTLQVILLLVLVPVALYLLVLTIPVLLAGAAVLAILKAMGVDLAPLGQLFDRLAAWVHPTVSEIPTEPAFAEGADTIRLATAADIHQAFNPGVPVAYGRRPGADMVAASLPD